MKFHHGAVPIQTQDLSGITLVHGGAGPADPKGEQADRAHEAIAQIATELKNRPVRTALPEWLCPPHIPKSRAEHTALCAAVLLERQAQFNAGFGAALQADGQARVSASFMESTRTKFSAVANASEILHPSCLAYYLQSERFCVRDGMAAAQLARELSIPCDSLVTPARFDRWVALKRESVLRGALAADGKGTVGCVTVDAEAMALAAVTSTGGVGNEPPGRMGDTPTVAGNYCSKQVAISCTGYGEQILDLAFAARLATRVDDGTSLSDAFARSLSEASMRGFGLAAIAVALSADRTHLDWAAGSTEDYFIWAAVLGSKQMFTFREAPAVAY